MDPAIIENTRTPHDNETDAGKQVLPTLHYDVPNVPAVEAGFLARLRGEAKDAYVHGSGKTYTSPKSQEQWRQGWELAGRLPEAETAARRSGGRYEITRSQEFWIRLAIEIVVILLAALSVYFLWRQVKIQQEDIRIARKTQATARLNDAWDILGGGVGTSTMNLEFYETGREPAMAPNISEVKLELARRLIWEAFDLAPKIPLVHRRKGHYYQIRGDNERAEESFRQAVKLGPDDPATHNNLGTFLESQVRYDDAAASFNRAIQIDPENVVAYNNLGIIFFNQKKYDEAEVSWRKSVSLAPNDARARNNLGTVLLKQGETKEAEEHLLKAVELDPEYATALANLAEALAAQGKLDQAIERYQQARDLDPENVEIRAMLEELQMVTDSTNDGGPS